MEDLQKDNIENATQEIVNCGDFAPKMKNLARDVEVAGAQLTSLGSQLAAIGKMLQQSELLGVLLALNRISGEIRGFPESGEVHEAIGHKEEHPWSAVLQKICGVIKNPPKNETPSHQYEELQKMNEDERQKNEEWKKKYDALNNEYKNKCGEFLLKADNLTRAYNKIAVLEDSNSRLKEENLSLDKENERLNDEKTSMEKKAESLELRIKELENDLEKNQSLVDVLNGRIDTINDEKHKLAAKLDRKEGELNTAREQNAALDAQMPPNAPELKEIAEKLEQIPANFRGLASGYYNLEQFPVFLSQSGQYNLLTQFWEGCFDKCRNGAEPGNIADFLQLEHFHIENALLAAIADSRRVGARAIYLPVKRRNERFDFAKVKVNLLYCFGYTTPPILPVNFPLIFQNLATYTIIQANCAMAIMASACSDRFCQALSNPTANTLSRPLWT